MAIVDCPSISDNPLDIHELRHRRRESSLAQMVQCAVRRYAVQRGDLLLETLLHRERLGSTAIGRGVAVPHAHSLLVRRPFVVLGRSSRGLAWEAPDGEDVHLVAFVLTPGERSAEQHFRRVAHAAAALRVQRNRTRLLASDDALLAASLLLASDAR